MKKRTVVWAVDPADEWKTPEAVRAFAEWLAESEIRLLPVHVLAPRENRPPDLDTAARALEYHLGKVGIPRGVGSEVALSPSGSREDAVKTLLAIAKRENAAWIQVTSHGRSGLPRIVFGSFAEALLEKSTLPVLFLGEESPRPERTTGRHVALFPTDFSSRSTFRAFLDIARLLDLDIVICQVLSYPIVVGTGDVMSAYVPESYFAEQERRARRLSAAWVGVAEQRGVKATVLLREWNNLAVTGSSLLKIADEAKASFVALGTKSGPVDRILAGSVAYELFRARRYPALVYGPAAQRRYATTTRREAARAAHGKEKRSTT